MVVHGDATALRKAVREAQGRSGGIDGVDFGAGKLLRIGQGAGTNEAAQVQEELLERFQQHEPEPER